MGLSVKVQNSSRLERQETKKVGFPDGIARLITMKRRLWDAMDWLAENNSTQTYQETIDIAWQIAIEFHDSRKRSFEDNLRHSLESAIPGCVSAVIQHHNSLIQDDYAGS